jgi:RNA polymerase sigma-70 factor (ECF subfamily)
MNHQNGSNGNVSTEIVREQEGWLRELVRRLVADSDVDDVVQDTWVEAMKTPVYLNGSLRGWLRVVATRLAMRSHRSRSRRTRREQIAAHDGEVSTTDDDLLWAEVQTHLTTSVAALPEPYRETITLRYFEGMSAREIADRTRTPVWTSMFGWRWQASRSSASNRLLVTPRPYKPSGKRPTADAPGTEYEIP